MDIVFIVVGECPEWGGGISFTRSSDDYFPREIKVMITFPDEIKGKPFNLLHVLSLLMAVGRFAVQDPLRRG